LTTQVLGLRDCLEVLRVAAKGHATQVVNLISVWEGSDELKVSRNVGEDVPGAAPSGSTYHSIAPAGSCGSGPYPAAFVAFLLDAGP
jgi:hypothetical protein